jgi:hypothetical protein
VARSGAEPGYKCSGPCDNEAGTVSSSCRSSGLWDAIVGNCTRAPTRKCFLRLASMSGSCSGKCNFSMLHPIRYLTHANHTVFQPPPAAACQEVDTAFVCSPWPASQGLIAQSAVLLHVACINTWCAAATHVRCLCS